ncbi:hypothetical protein F7725_009345 [Dissostichus mawsoni]|uniref:Uncharacterized protein n=1 Tax=Dissostichus mawsoni TaxID=36200 RepID=A0A7J5Z750_DISMA|nr:hypothetical protein F7725_009345 [Dissostichus mawsoni]
MVQNLLEELKALITGQGSAAERLLSHLEQSLSSQQMDVGGPVQTAVELQDELTGVRKDLRDTQSQLRDREEENSLLTADLEATRSRLRDSEREKTEYSSLAQQRLEERENCNRVLQSLESTKACFLPQQPPPERITHFLLSLGQPVSAERGDNSVPLRDTSSHPDVTLTDQSLCPHEVQAGGWGLLSHADGSVCSDLSSRSGSTLDSRAEAAFRDGLAALDASIASLQRTFQLDLEVPGVGPPQPPPGRPVGHAAAGGATQVQRATHARTTGGAFSIRPPPHVQLQQLLGLGEEAERVEEAVSVGQPPLPAAPGYTPHYLSEPPCGWVPHLRDPEDTGKPSVRGSIRNTGPQPSVEPGLRAAGTGKPKLQRLHPDKHAALRGGGATKPGLESDSVTENAEASDGKDVFVRVRKSDLEKLTTEVMQLREFLPREHLVQEQDQLRQDCVHLQARLEAGRLNGAAVAGWSRAAAAGRLLLCSGISSLQSAVELLIQRGHVTRWLADGKLQSFLAVAAQTLESFVRSLDEEEKTQTEDHNSHEHQFVLALAGTITNIAAVTCGRDFLSTSAQDLLDTLMKMLELMKPGVFPKLKVISVRGLKCISENTGLLPLICTLLDGVPPSVRLLQSVLLEEEVLLLLGPPLLDPRLQAAVSRLTSSLQPGLRLAAQQTLEDLQTLQQVPLGGLHHVMIVEMTYFKCGHDKLKSVCVSRVGEEDTAELVFSSRVTGMLRSLRPDSLPPLTFGPLRVSSPSADRLQLIADWSTLEGRR